MYKKQTTDNRQEKTTTENNNRQEKTTQRTFAEGVRTHFAAEEKSARSGRLHITRRACVVGTRPGATAEIVRPEPNALHVEGAWFKV